MVTLALEAPHHASGGYTPPGRARPVPAGPRRSPPSPPVPAGPRRSPPVPAGPRPSPAAPGRPRPSPLRARLFSQAKLSIGGCDTSLPVCTRPPPQSTGGSERLARSRAKTMGRSGEAVCAALCHHVAARQEAASGEGGYTTNLAVPARPRPSPPSRPVPAGSRRFPPVPAGPRRSPPVPAGPRPSPPVPARPRPSPPVPARPRPSPPCSACSLGNRSDAKLLLGHRRDGGQTPRCMRGALELRKHAPHFRRLCGFVVPAVDCLVAPP